MNSRPQNAPEHQPALRSGGKEALLTAIICFLETPCWGRRQETHGLRPLTAVSQETHGLWRGFRLPHTTVITEQMRLDFSVRLCFLPRKPDPLETSTELPRRNNTASTRGGKKGQGHFTFYCLVYHQIFNRSIAGEGRGQN